MSARLVIVALHTFQEAMVFADESACSGTFPAVHVGAFVDPEQRRAPPLPFFVRETAATALGCLRSA
jgi:hypothetical protein